MVDVSWLLFRKETLDKRSRTRDLILQTVLLKYLYSLKISVDKEANIVVGMIVEEKEK